MADLVMVNFVPDVIQVVVVPAASVDVVGNSAITG